MMQFIARLRELSGGKPTGFKLCIGHPWEWFAMVKAMQVTGITPDFIVVDGAEGGIGAAPLEFTDHVGSPLQEGLLLLVGDKTERVFNFHQVTLKALKELVQATGLNHPSQITAHHIVRRSSDHKVQSLEQLILTQMEDGILLQADLSRLSHIYQRNWPQASAHSFTLQKA